MKTQAHIYTSQIEDLEPSVTGRRGAWTPCLRVNGEIVWKAPFALKNRDEVHSNLRPIAARQVATMVWHAVRGDSIPGYLACRAAGVKVRTTAPEGSQPAEWTELDSWVQDVATELTLI